MIEEIHYLIKQLDSCACTPQSCMVYGSGCSCCNGLLIEKRLCNIKFFHEKPNIFDEGMESKLEQYNKGSKGNINSKGVKQIKTLNKQLLVQKKKKK